MDIRQRLRSFKDLQTHALQDYLCIVLDKNFRDEEWKVHFQSFVDRQKKKGYANNVDAAFEKIAIYGPENYSVAQMDASLVINYLRFGRLKTVNDEIRGLLDNLQKDRNIDAHANGNETDKELYHYAIIAMSNLESFVNAVWTDQTLDETPELLYVRKYAKEIASLRNKFDSDYRETMKADFAIEMIKRDIDTVVNSRDQLKVWDEIHNKYNKEWVMTKDEVAYQRFLQMAADAEIVFAYAPLGYSLFALKDYEKAARYLELSIKHDWYTPDNLLLLASIYHNRLCSGRGENDERIVLEQWKKTPVGSKYQLYTYTTKEGYIFYDQKKVQL